MSLTNRVLATTTALIAGSALAWATPALASGTERVRVQDARDGNTLVVRAASGAVKTIGIAGIVTPRITGASRKPQCGSRQARSYLQSLLKGKVVTITPAGDASNDAYQVKLRGSDVGGALVRRGWALPALDGEAGAALYRAYSERAATAFKLKAGIYRACNDEQVKKFASSRIIGGIDAPYANAVPIMSSGQPDPFQATFCTGTPIGQRWVLTARHCVAGKAPGAIQTAFGVLNLYSIGSADRIGVISIRAFPAFGANVGDIALLEVDRDLPAWTSFASASGSSENYVGRTATIYGWGRASSSGYPSTLQAAALPVVYDSLCASAYGGYSPSYELCAGYASGVVDSCDGDSGGPLYVGTTLVGVTKGGTASCNYYGTYSDLSNPSLNAFIRSEMAKPTPSSAAGGGAASSSAPVVPSSGTPRSGDDVPCPRGMYQQDKRSVETDWLYKGKPAVRVVSRIRIFNEPLCAKDIVFILTDKRNGKRLPQLPGSTLGYRQLEGKVSAPKVSWPPAREFKYASGDPSGAGRRNARLVHVAFYLKKSGRPTTSEDIELRVVRDLGTGLQSDNFGPSVGWAATESN